MALNIGQLVGFLDLDASAFEDTLGGAMDKLKELGPKGAAIAGAAGALIGTSIAAGVLGGMDIEKANDKLAAQLGAGSTDAQRLGEVAGNLYAGAYGDSIGQVNDAIASVVTSISDMSEASYEEIEKVTGKALDFATAMNVDVADAATTAGALVNTGLAKDANEAFDLLTVAAQKAGPAMVQPVMDATNEYSKHFAMLGYDGQEAMSVISSAAAGGEIAIDKAGDAVKELGIRATDLNDAGAQQSFKDLGLSGKEMANDLLAGGERAQSATAKIANALLGVKDPAKQAAIAGGLFGTQIEDIGKDQIPGFLSALSGAGPQLDNVDGAAARMGATLNDNAATNIESFKRKAQQAFVDLIGGKALPVVNDIAAALNGKFEPALSLVGTALTAVTGFIMDHKTAALVLVGVITALVAVTQLHAAVMAVQAAGGILAYLATLGPVRAATAAWTAVQWALNSSLLGNPITWVVVALIALVAAIVYAYKNSETFRNIVNAAWSGIKTGVKAVVDWLTTAIPAVFKWIVTAFQKYTPVGIVLSHWGQIRDFIGSAVSWIQGAIGWFATLPGKFATWFGRANAAAIGKATELVNFIKGLPGKVLSGLGNIGSTLYNAGADLIGGLLDGAGSMLSRLGSFFLDAVPGWIREPFKKALGIHSPSRVMSTLARWIPLGVVEGVKSEAGTVQAAMRDLVQPPAMPALTVPQVRLPARALLDPAINRDAAARYGQDPAGAGKVDLSAASIDALAARFAQIQVEGVISTSSVSRAMGGGYR